MPQNIWEIFDANPGGASGKEIKDAEGNVTGHNPTMIGHKAVSAALAANYSIADIEKALSSDLGIARTAEVNRPSSSAGVHRDLEQTGPTSMWGTHGDTATRTAAENRDRYIGDADINFMRQQGVSDQDIMEHWQEHGLQNPNANSGLTSSYRDVTRGATIASQGQTISNMGGELSNLQGDYQNLSSQYGTLQSAYDAMGDKYTGLQKDVAQAAKDALKIKYTGSTGVRNPSAMGIQAAQGTPFRGSGLAGTAALARPNRGMKIKTLNV